MKKYLSILLMMFLLCTFFTACSKKTTSSKKDNSNQSDEVVVIDVADFGAKGDGVTDDYKAISSAINEAHKHENGVTIKFKSDSTYLIKESILSEMALELSGLKNVTLQGDNTTIMVDGYDKFLTTLGSENLTISGFNFKYSKSIYTLSDVVDINLQEKTMTIKSEDSLGISDLWISPLLDDTFGMVDYELERQHIFFNEIEVVDEANHIYKLKLTLRNGSTEIGYLANMKDKNLKFITPIPDVAHIEGSAFTVYNSKNVVFENCNIWSASYFVFSLRYNEDTISFINTNLEPEPGSNGKMMSWRDQFHCKDNRANLVWKNCKIKAGYDDVFNISCTINKVTEVISPKEVKIFCEPIGSTYPAEIRVGDKVSIYNADNGLFCGTTEVVNVTNNEIIELKDKLSNISVGVTVAIDSLAAPNSLIENCEIEGTMRIQTKATFNNTKFKLLHGWIGNAGWTDAEGTIPNDVLFKNCEFAGFQNNKYLKIATETATYVQPKYYSKNIVFEDCKVKSDNLEVMEGNDVKIIENGSVVYSSLK